MEKINICPECGRNKIVESDRGFVLEFLCADCGLVIKQIHKNCGGDVEQSLKRESEHAGTAITKCKKCGEVFERLVEID